MLMTSERRPAIRTMRGWAIDVLQNAGACVGAACLSFANSANLQKAYLFSQMLFNVIDDNLFPPAREPSTTHRRLASDPLVDTRQFMGKDARERLQIWHRVDLAAFNRTP